MNIIKKSVGVSILKIFLNFCLLILSGSIGISQTIITGKVTDDMTFEPVVFANVIFKGTSIGVKTGFDGRFILNSITKSDSVIISFIGYETRVIPIVPGTEQQVDIKLHPATYSLNEILVRPGENPAHKILRKVWKNKELNSLEKNGSYQYDNYSRLTLYLRKFNNEDGKKRLFNKEFEKYGIKTGEDEATAIPAFINETFSTTYFQNSPERTYTEIKAINKSGLSFEKTDLIAQLALKEEEMDFSGNNMLIADKNFISPLSRSGPLYYKYYLIDSLYLGRYFCYEINVIPKREEDAVFKGTMWINDTTFALKRISVEVTGKSEINFIERMKIQQECEPQETGSWAPVKTRIMADAVNVFFSNYSEKSNFKFNNSVDPGFFSSEIKIDPDKITRNQEFWDTRRMRTLDRADSLAIDRISDLKADSKIRMFAKIVEASVRGYYDFGKFEAGPLMMSYNYNSVEGNRFRVGGRTNMDFSKDLFLEGYLAYGTYDRKFKGSIKSDIFLSKEHWTKIGFQFGDDIERVGSADDFYSGESFISFASSFGGWDKMNRAVTLRSWIESDISKGLNAKIFISRKTFDPVSPDYYFGWYSDLQRNEIRENFISGEIGLSLMFQPKAVYVVDGLRRFPVNFNKFPVFSFTWSRGIKNMLGGDFNFNRITAEVYNNFSIGGLGRINFDFIYSRIPEQLPYPLLVNAPGNESIFYSGYLFNLMKYGEFVADEAFQAFVEYHMDGLIMNKIPLIKKLNLRTVVSGRLFVGSFNEEINGFYDLTNNPRGLLPVSVNNRFLTSFNPAIFSRPYGELSYGVENIFKFIRVDLVQSLSWLNNPGAERFGIKFSGVFRF